jgi:hypothetical protein
MATSVSIRRVRDVDAIFEELVDVDYDVFESVLDELAEANYIVRAVDVDEDRVSYSARDGLGWSEVAQLANPMKKQILLTLIDNPRTFFVLRNTQTGKSEITINEIKAWIGSGKKVVAFLIVDNDKSLADQTVQGLGGNIHPILLSSSAKDTSVETMRTYVDAYAADSDGEYKMPVIVALNNPSQVNKVLKVMYHIKTKVDVRGSNLRYGVVFDEADKVYPPMRVREFPVGDGVATSFKKLLVESDIAVHRLGFVTATDGDLLENDEFEECANAYMYQVPEADPDYRGLHTADSNARYMPHKIQDNNDVYAEQVLAANEDYFYRQKVTLKNGTQAHRKIIVNGGAKTESMKGFALRRNAMGAYAITLNMHGLTVYRPGMESVRRSSKGKRLSVLLFELYNELGLHDKPLFIIGRRKVDRGLGFHHAPRDGSNGLVWTDMILGRIADKDSAVQKAGRLAGVVAQCPQYPGALTWWTDERTASMIRRHNGIVDAACSPAMRGHTALQAVARAKEAVPEAVNPTHAVVNWCVPIKLILPASLMDSPEFQSSISESRRPALSQAILALLAEDKRVLLAGRTLKTKRSTMSKTRAIRRAYDANIAHSPGGGIRDDVSMRHHFYLDFVAEEQADMPRGTAFITYCTV